MDDGDRLGGVDIRLGHKELDKKEPDEWSVRLFFSHLAAWLRRELKDSSTSYSAALSPNTAIVGGAIEISFVVHN